MAQASSIPQILVPIIEATVGPRKRIVHGEGIPTHAWAEMSMLSGVAVNDVNSSSRQLAVEFVANSGDVLPFRFDFAPCFETQQLGICTTVFACQLSLGPSPDKDAAQLPPVRHPCCRAAPGRSSKARDWKTCQPQRPQTDM